MATNKKKLKPPAGLPPIGKMLSKAERDQIDIDLFAEGGSVYEITQPDGKRYRITNKGLVPMTGSKAQAVVKRQRKAKKPASTATE